MSFQYCNGDTKSLIEKVFFLLGEFEARFRDPTHRFSEEKEDLERLPGLLEYLKIPTEPSERVFQMVGTSHLMRARSWYTGRILLSLLNVRRTGPRYINGGTFYQMCETALDSYVQGMVYRAAFRSNMNLDFSLLLAMYEWSEEKKEEVMIVPDPPEGRVWTLEKLQTDIVWHRCDRR